MAFPSDLEIEIAFNNDIDETIYAQSGWTSVLPFVSGFSGDLRGRAYELDRAEAGTLSVALDNSDGRFLPGSVQSPYYPYVKSDRRFRIRGKNMVHPNVARGGSRDHSLQGFLDDFGGLDNYTVAAYSMDSVRQVTASAEPNAGIGQGKEKVNDGLSTTMWTINTQAGWLQYKIAIGVRIQRYTLIIPAGNPNNNPKSWTLQGSNNGSSWTTIHTVTGNTWTSDYEEQEFIVTSPNFYLYYKLDITANIGATSNTQLAEWIINYNDSTDLLLPDSDLDWYVEVDTQASLPINTWHETVAWYIPLEYGVRLSHSAYIWRISGTEPTGAKYKLHVTYYDNDFNQVNATVDPRWEVATPSTQTPTQVALSHAPPSTAKYAIASFAVFISSTTNTDPLVYGITGVQTELPANLAADISGFRDTFNWQTQGDGDSVIVSAGGFDPTTSYLSVTWGANDVNMYQTIPHLIPGEQYTATVQAKILSGQPNVLFSGDEGETGALINSTTFTQYTCYFEAQQPEQELRFILQGTPTVAEGLQIRKLRVEKGENLTLSLPTSAVDTALTTWSRPKDIFEGWVESWPAVAGSVDMTITVNDRMKRIGQIDLENTLRESLLQDYPSLLLPLTDSMIDSPGRFSQLGNWANEDGGPSYVDIAHSRGDLGVSTYTTRTDDGPTGEASFLNSPVGTGTSAVGYFFAIPYSKDYVAPTTPVTPPPAPKPPPTSTPTQKATYTKKWYATWSRSYEGDDSTRFDDTPYMYQGSYDGSSPGNQKSLAGFDYKNIMQTLKGADIVECHITVKNNHARWNKGLYAEIGSHNYSSKGSTWIDSQVRQRRWTAWVAEGGSVTVNAGTTFGKELQSGSSRGIGLGPEATNDHDNYGYFYGATHSARPYITVKYRK